MNTFFPNIQELEFLKDVPRFFCFCRVWWDGNGVDFVVWWQDATGCFRKVMQTGETTEITRPALTSIHAISETELTAIIDEFVSLGVLEIDSQEKKIIYSHFDDWFGIQSLAMVDSYWLKIAGGRHSSSKASVLLDSTIAHCSEIFLHTDS